MLRKKIIFLPVIMYLIPVLYNILSPDTELGELTSMLGWLFSMIPPMILPFLYGTKGIILVSLIILIVAPGSTIIDHYGDTIPLLDYIY